MPNKKPSGPSVDLPLQSRIAVLAHKLEAILDNLNANADSLAGDLFHHDALFGGSDCGRLDEKLAELIAELKSLTSLEFDE